MPESSVLTTRLPSRRNDSSVLVMAGMMTSVMRVIVGDQ